MKRVRSEEEEVVVVLVDWVALFHVESILIILHPYLSTADVIHLSCVNKKMNTTWINDERRLSVLQMRKRVHDFTGRLYNVRNPLIYMKKAVLKALALPKPGSKRFTCWKCKTSKSMIHLVTIRQLFPYTTCVECAKKKMEETHLCGSTYLAIEWYLKRVLVPIGVSLYNLEIWFRQNKSVLQEFMEEHRKAFFFNAHYWSYYTPVKFVVPLIERAQQEVLNAVHI